MLGVRKKTVKKKRANLKKLCGTPRTGESPSIQGIPKRGNKNGDRVNSRRTGRKTFSKGKRGIPKLGQRTFARLSKKERQGGNRKGWGARP